MAWGTMRQKARRSQLTANETRITNLENSTVTEAVVTLTSAQVLALNTTPRTLVAAPWAWKFIDVESITWYVDYNSAAYATNTTLEFRYTNASWAKVTADEAALLTATADKVNTVKAVTTELVNVVNAPVVVNVATWDPITGNSPVKFIVRYKVVTL